MKLDEIMLEYEKKTPNSKKAFTKAMTAVAGGISANIKFFEPYPIFMDYGKGAWLTDVDGNRYVDYVLSYGPLILGHGNEQILQAMQVHFAEHGTMLYGTPHEMETAFAEKLRSYYPSIELLRYTNSGTEATLLTIRLAYAYTHKYKIAKFEGHYHGGYNEVLVSVNPDLSKAGDIRHPNSLPESAGLPPYQLEETLVLPFNDLEACREILTEHKDEVAAVIMEPIISGFIPATHEFMKGIRALTSELGILMIMDEVKTGFRVTLGGAQQYYDVKPDLTALGKVIGSGLPIGVVGGKKEILLVAAPLMGSDVFDMSASKRSRAQNVLFHSGTYNGHPTILSMGMKTIEILEQNLDIITARTTQLREGIKQIYMEHGIHVSTPGLGTMFNVAITDLDEIHTYRDMQTSNFELRKKVDYALICEGVYNKPGNRYNISLAHDDEVIDFTLESYRRVLNRVL